MARAPDGLGAFLMPRRARQHALFSPAAVTVHDDRHMRGQLGDIRGRFWFLTFTKAQHALLIGP